MRIMLCTLALNEIEWLPKLWAQHKDWPGLVHWCFVESADVTYQKCNPDRVSPTGCSVDGTTEYLSDIATRDHRVSHIKFGFCETRDVTQAKCVARQQYMIQADRVRPDYIVVLDADEFYSRGHQSLMCEVLDRLKRLPIRSYLFQQRHLWLPPSQRGGNPLESEVIGGYWKVPHYRVWRWQHGLRYVRNHNWLEDRRGQYLIKQTFRYDKRLDLPTGKALNGCELPHCVHTGFASSLESRSAKHRYYVARGEGVRDKRSSYVECRSAFESWRPGDTLPHNASVIPYRGPIPEVLAPHAKDPSSPNLLLASAEHAASDPGLA